MNGNNLFELFVNSEKRKFDDNFALYVVRVFNAIDIKELHTELTLFRNKQLLNELDKAVFDEISQDTHQGRELGAVFPEIFRLLPQVHFGEKCRVAFGEDGSFDVFENDGRKSPRLKHALTINDMMHEINVACGVRAEQGVIELLMENPAFFDIDNTTVGSFSNAVDICKGSVSSVLGREVSFEFYFLADEV